MEVGKKFSMNCYNILQLIIMIHTFANILIFNFCSDKCELNDRLEKPHNKVIIFKSR